MKVLTIVSQKGGVGKTTLATGLAAMAAKLKRQVVLIDLDPQASATFWADIRKRTDFASTPLPAARLLQRATEWNAASRPSNRLLSGADITDAKEWAASRPSNAPEPTSLHLEFIRASEEEEHNRAGAERKRLEEMAAAQAEREKALRLAEDATRKRTRLRIAAFLGLTIIAAVAGWQWWEAKQANTAVALERDNARALTTKAEAARLEADAQRRAAIAAKAVAEAEGQKAVAARVRQLALAAASRIDKGDPISAITMALDALPDPSNLNASDYPHIQFTLDTALRTLHERRVYHGPQIGADYSVRFAGFSPDGQQVVTSSRDGAVRVFDRATGDIARVFEEKSADFRQAWLSIDGQFVTAIGHPRSEGSPIRRIWSMQTGELVSDFKGNHQRTGVRPVFGHPRIVTGPFDYANPEEAFKSWGADGTVSLGTSGRLSPDGSRFLRKFAAARLDLVDTLDGRVIAQHLYDTHAASDWVFSDNSRYYAIARAGDAVVDVFDSATGTHRGRVPGALPYGTLRLSDDGATLIHLRGRREGGVEAREISFYDFRSGQLRATAVLDKRLFTVTSDLPQPAELFYPFDLVVGPDGSRVLVRTFAEQWELWDGMTASRLATIGPDLSNWPSARFSPDGSLIATPHKDEVVRVWRASDGVRIATLGGHQHSLTALGFSADGSSLLTASNDGTARLWSVQPVLAGRILPLPREVRSSSEVGIGDHFDDPVRGVAFSPDGSRLLAATGRSVGLYEVNTGRLLKTIKTQKSGTMGMTCSP